MPENKVGVGLGRQPVLAVKQKRLDQIGAVIPPRFPWPDQPPMDDFQAYAVRNR
jgi:hypothetical protein